MLDFGFYNMDCMKGMAEFPDNYFDLAIVDPPYGLGYDTKAEECSGQQYGNAAAQKRHYHGGGWDIKPSKEYFDELIRVSKNQIVWGGELLHRVFTTVKRVYMLGQTRRGYE